MALPIGGFMPIPLAMMIPFMATQSMVMGDAFGRAFQYGKRKISAMSNEEFNATTIEEQAANMFKSYKLIIPKLNEAIDDSSELQRKIISEMLLILPKFISETGTQVFGGTDIRTEIEEHPHSIQRPHIHSGGPPTITGKTTSNGITTTHYSDGTSTTSGTSTPSPTSAATIQKAMTIYVYTTTSVKETTIKRFFNTAWPSATILSYRHAGTANIPNEGKGTRKQTILIHYRNTFPLPSVTEILGPIYARL